MCFRHAPRDAPGWLFLCPQCLGPPVFVPSHEVFACYRCQLLIPYQLVTMAVGLNLMTDALHNPVRGN